MVRIVILAMGLVVLGCAGPAQSPAARMEREAAEAARFLSGHARFDALHLADSVDLYVAPEGGGGRQRFPREALRQPQFWQVASGGRTRSFVPGGLRTRLVTAPGKHMNCQPTELSNRFPNLATLPHVGVRLEPPRVKSCLETWNITFIFDTTGGDPRIVAAVYDQWEW